MSNTQIKSKKRVKEAGEVFTRKIEVMKMLHMSYFKTSSLPDHSPGSLTDDEAEKLYLEIPVDDKILEPSCGTGNFLIEILEGKLNYIRSKNFETYYEIEFNTIKAVSSIYGIEFMPDNLEECIDRLYIHINRFLNKSNHYVLGIIEQILKLNLVYGDSLKMRCRDDENKFIEFYNWTFDESITGESVSFRQFAMRDKDNKDLKIVAVRNQKKDVQYKIKNPKIEKGKLEKVEFNYSCPSLEYNNLFFDETDILGSFKDEELNSLKEFLKLDKKKKRIIIEEAKPELDNYFIKLTDNVQGLKFDPIDIRHLDTCDKQLTDNNMQVIFNLTEAQHQDLLSQVGKDLVTKIESLETELSNVKEELAKAQAEIARLQEFRSNMQNFFNWSVSHYEEIEAGKGKELIKYMREEEEKTQS
jgi:hypothetical protein